MRPLVSSQFSPNPYGDQDCTSASASGHPTCSPAPTRNWPPGANLRNTALHGATFGRKFASDFKRSGGFKSPSSHTFSRADLRFFATCASPLDRVRHKLPVATEKARGRVLETPQFALVLEGHPPRACGAPSEAEVELQTDTAVSRCDRRQVPTSGLLLLSPAVQVAEQVGRTHRDPRGTNDVGCPVSVLRHAPSTDGGRRRIERQGDAPVVIDSRADGLRSSEGGGGGAGNEGCPAVKPGVRALARIRALAAKAVWVALTRPDVSPKLSTPVNAPWRHASLSVARPAI